MELKKKSCQKSLGILVSLATVSATPEYGVFWVFSLILPVIIQNALPLLYNWMISGITAVYLQTWSVFFKFWFSTENPISKVCALSVTHLGLLLYHICRDCLNLACSFSSFIWKPKTFLTLYSQNLLILPSGIDKCHLALVWYTTAKVVHPKCRTLVVYIRYSPGTRL